MSIAWFKNRLTDLKYTGWLIKNWNHLRRGKYSLAPFLLYWLLYPIPRLLFGGEKAPEVSRAIIKRFMDGNLYIPLPISPTNTYWIGLRDSVDFGAFREVCIENHYNHSQLLGPGMTVVDIGAHIGTFTLLASKKVGEQGKVITIEPEIHNFEQLKKNLELNGIKNVIPVNVALSDFNGKEDFFISKGSGCHSFFPRCDDIIDKIQIRVRTLDTLLRELNIKRVNLLKIDAEEAELKILKGARETLIKNPQMKMAIAAYHSSQQALEITEYLKELNFSPRILPGIFTLVIV